ncbi:MAG: VTT domain-containing protein [Kiritimatiellia bacterium]
MSSILKTGKNCWRIDQADKLRFVVDAADYFRFFREALKKAEKSVYILCWDINSQIALVRDEKDDGYPTRLGDFLNFLVGKKPDLNIYILDWDFAMLYTFDRELHPIYKLGWKTPEQIHFKLDNYLPEGASQHQKIVVVDDSTAFVGGLDLTMGRWDTSDHVADNPQRDRINEKISRPYHDIQVMVSGDAARALGEIARDSWRKVTAEVLSPPNSDGTRDAWPEDIIPDMKNVMIGLARTQAAYKEQKEVREIEHFYRDAILSARQYIYFENQFFTAPSIGKAVQSILEREDGPEIVLVTPRETDGWLPQHTMDVLRVRLIRKLKQHDHYDRLRVFYPDGPGLTDSPINVHAKVMLVDDRLVTVGSANLNNRSMGLDAECNVIVEAGKDQAVADSIAAFRNRLLAEHLDCPVEQFSKTLNTNETLLGCIDMLNKKGKNFLESLPLKISPEVDRLVPDTELLDPEHPIRPELMMRHIVPEEFEKSTRSRIITWIVLITLIAGLAAMWRWTPLNQWANINTLSVAVEFVRKIPAAPVWVVLGFVLAGLVAFPFSLLIVVTVITFGPVMGFICSLIGGTLSAVVLYWVGDLLGRNVVRRMGGSKINKISKKIARHGIVNIIFVRIVPVAPYTLINLVAGASHISFRYYIIGTLLGLIPGMLAVTFLADRIKATVQSPETNNVIWLIVTAIIVISAAYLLVTWLKRKSGERASSD